MNLTILHAKSMITMYKVWNLATVMGLDRSTSLSAQLLQPIDGKLRCPEFGISQALVDLLVMQHPKLRLRHSGNLQ
jgi:hypothetical protein